MKKAKPKPLIHQEADLTVRRSIARYHRRHLTAILLTVRLKIVQYRIAKEYLRKRGRKIHGSKIR